MFRFLVQEGHNTKKYPREETDPMAYSGRRPRCFDSSVCKQRTENLRVEDDPAMMKKGRELALPPHKQPTTRYR